MCARSLKIMFTIILTGLIVHLNAQERLVHGVVTTFDSIAVIGADVYVKSSKQTVKSDTLGQFLVQVLGEDKLKISAKGFQTYSVKLKDNTKVVAVNMKLKQGDKAREYAIGYGYVKDGEKLNSIAQMTSDDLDFSMYDSMYDLIRGRFAGVQVQSNGDIIIRGINSINLSSGALIIVDGVPVDNSYLETIPPVTVKSINVLKDSSSSIYGARGANGVIVIETKRGDD